MQILIDGLISGFPLALVALGFVLVYVPARVFFLALAGIYSLAPFLVWQFRNGGHPSLSGIAMSLATCVLLAILAEFLNHWPLAKKQAPDGAHLVSSLGIYIVVVQIIAIIWGNEVKVLRAGIDTTYSFSSIVLTRSQLLCAIVPIILLTFFFVGLRFTNAGLLFRALADNPIEFALKGHNVRAWRLAVFALAGLLASTAALLTANDLGFDPHGGLSSLLLGVIAVIVGGRRTFFGPVLGAVILSVIRSEVVWLLSARWEQAATFALLAIFLFFRPHGILGRKIRLEAE